MDKNLEITCSHPGNLFADIDLERTEQVLVNLMDNAIKFSDPGATITVALQKEAGWITVSVKDQGRGIPEENVNYKSKTVSVKGRNIRLTRTEFEILELFTTYPGEALTRDFIQKQIWWDSQLYTHSRALDVHIQRLRKKIEETPENPKHIITISGVGYKFMAG